MYSWISDLIGSGIGRALLANSLAVEKLLKKPGFSQLTNKKFVAKDTQNFVKTIIRWLTEKETSLFRAIEHKPSERVNIRN